MTKEIQPTKENNKIISDVVAIKVKEELEAKETFADDLVKEVNSEITLRWIQRLFFRYWLEL